MERVWRGTEPIVSVEFCDEPGQQDLIAYGTQKKVGILSLDLESSEVNELLVYQMGVRVDKIAWSNVTSNPRNGHPLSANLFLACSDFKIHNLVIEKGSPSITQTLIGHSDYIHDISIRNVNLKEVIIASTGDDLTCRIWRVNGDSISEILFNLSSPGISVKWHPQQPDQLLVAEQSGTIRMYNLETNTIQLSLYAGQKPLLAADWNPFDSTRIGALIDKKWAIWNLREQNPRSIYTEIEDIAFVERGKHFQWCKGSQTLFVVSSQNTLRFIDANDPQNAQIISYKQRIDAFSWRNESLTFVVVNDCSLIFGDLK